MKTIAALNTHLHDMMHGVCTNVRFGSLFVLYVALLNSQTNFKAVGIF
jgi:hypothetical protein